MEFLFLFHFLEVIHIDFTLGNHSLWCFKMWNHFTLWFHMKRIRILSNKLNLFYPTRTLLNVSIVKSIAEILLWKILFTERIRLNILFFLLILDSLDHLINLCLFLNALTSIIKSLLLRFINPSNYLLTSLSRDTLRQQTWLLGTQLVNLI